MSHQAVCPHLVRMRGATISSDPEYSSKQNGH
eukprot:COSAG02_NODE_49205_length_328_cov_0.877729_1_plen_31_part_10